ncbi:MAG: hypothetical protein KGH87_04645 [Thaumarchaeota archaeon]|nr:hypothetical protein [Candidatus Nitrosotalea sp.]MDE1813202.1 hypothetical protein [Nitrososphaerota archaeon]MDE1839192.1 hypothetical protein [Nitrososphaerota archaeon]
MKTLHLSIIVSGVAISILAYLLLVPTTDTISWNVSKSANYTASKYGIFPHETDWHVHITSDGKILPVTDNHKIDENSIFTCSFSVIPNDARDHFAYLSVFRNDDTGYVIALDDHTGKAIYTKPVPLELAVCGP